jgi:hypothetical protein
MFASLTDELLDLTATEKGVGAALYAAADEPGCCSSGCSCNGCSILLCCFLCSLCF